MKKLTKESLKDVSEAIGAVIGGVLSPYLKTFLLGTVIEIKVVPVVNMLIAAAVGFVLFQIGEMVRPGAFAKVADSVAKAEKTAGKRANYMPRATVAFILALLSGPIMQAIMAKIPGMVGVS